MAAGEGRVGGADRSTTVDAAGRHRLARAASQLGPGGGRLSRRDIVTQAGTMSVRSMKAGVNSRLMPEAVDPVEEIAALRALLAEREAELVAARSN